ncbi:MAG TPA: AraC family transcriptional regulator ligand-binding domain-containing protein [Moraxellaceae bacterium]|nr:AraC family transcriptional regulator ligand-binding domain-containing protein [Moraxellaceae bacterium]
MIIERPNSDSTVISGTFIRLLLEYLASQGIDGHALLGINHDDPVAATYPLQQWGYFLDSAATRLNDPLLGLHLGRSITMGHLGVLGYVLHSCGNIGGPYCDSSAMSAFFTTWTLCAMRLKAISLSLAGADRLGRAALLQRIA